MTKRTLATAAISVTVLALSACTKVETVDLPSPVVDAPSQAPSSTPSTYSPSPKANEGSASGPTDLPPKPPKADPGKNNAQGVVIGSDARELNFTDTIEYPYYDRKGETSVGWMDADRNTLTLYMAKTFVGTRKTSADVSIQLDLLGAGSFVSGDGGCSVTIDKATQRSLTGSVKCLDWKSTDGKEEISAVIGFNGEFAAA